MKLNTILLLLLVIASYSNLYLNFQRKKRRRNKNSVQLKEWDGMNTEKTSFNITNTQFKEWKRNSEKLDK